MALIDDARAYDRLDVQGMAGHISDLPRQCREAWEAGLSFRLPSSYSQVDKVLVLGMGGSAIGGELARALLASRSEITLHSHRDYGLPAFVDSRTLVIASSYSGQTEETLDAFDRALKTSAKKLVMTTGGKLRGIAEKNGVPAFLFNYHSPPRAAIGYGLMPLLAVVQNLGLAPDLSSEVKEMLSVIEAVSPRYEPSTPLPDNPAKSLAAQLFKRVPVIYGAGILAPVAYRWKTQLNENGKTWAVCEVIPELNHNSVVGFGLPDNLNKIASVLMLRCPSLHPRHLARYTITGELLDKAGIPNVAVDSEAGSDLAQTMSLVYLGDWTSYYLGILNGANPSAVPAIDYLKDRLSHFPG